MSHQVNGLAIFGIIVGAIIGLILFIIQLVFLIQGIKYFALRRREIYKNNPDLLIEKQEKEEQEKEEQEKEEQAKAANSADEFNNKSQNDW